MVVLALPADAGAARVERGGEREVEHGAGVTGVDHGVELDAARERVDQPRVELVVDDLAGGAVVEREERLVEPAVFRIDLDLDES